MSPEQLKGEPLDPRTDIFSFGCVLYEMVSGRRAFARPSAAGTIAAILSGPPPRTGHAAGSEALPHIIGRCLETDRDRRYRSAQELLADLRGLRSGSTPVASSFGPAVGASPRAPPPAYVAAAVVAVMAAAGAWLWSTREAAPASADSVPVLAILPFATAPQDAQHVGEGISDDLVNILSQLPQLKVKSTAICATPATAWTCRRSGAISASAWSSPAARSQQDGMLVVQAQLHNAADGTLVWGKRYNRPVSDIFAVQEEIARDIASNLRLRLSRREDAGLSKRNTSSVDAYRNYMQGRAFAQRRTRPWHPEGVGHYQQAIAQDPGTPWRMRAWPMPTSC